MGISVPQVFHFGFGPAAVQADGAGDVFGESVAKIAFANEDIADETSGTHVEDATAGLTAEHC